MPLPKVEIEGKVFIRINGTAGAGRILYALFLCHFQVKVYKNPTDIYSEGHFEKIFLEIFL